MGTCRTRPLACVFLATFVVVLQAFFAPATAQDVSTWKKAAGGGIVGGNWGVAANWMGGVPNGKNAEADFLSGLAENATISLEKQYSLIALVIESDDPTKAYTLKSNGGGKGALELLTNPNNLGLNGNAALITVGSDNVANNVIAVPVKIAAPDGVEITNDSAAGMGRLTISGVISGGGANAGLVISGTGDVLLSGTNTYQSTIKVDGGNLLIQNDSGLGAAKNEVDLLNGGLLRGLKNASVSAARTIVLGDVTTGSSGILAGDPATKPDGSAYIFVVNAKIEAGGLNGVGEFLGIQESVKLTNLKNDFKVSGGILVGSSDVFGSLYVASDKVLGDASNKIMIGTLGTLVAYGTFASAREVDLDPKATIQVLKGQTLTLSGTVANGSGSLTKTGAGTLVLSGTNTYGRTTINGGVLAVGSDVNLGKAGRSITINNGATLEATGSFKTSRNIRISSGTILVDKGEKLTVNSGISGTTFNKGGAGTLELAKGSTSNLSGSVQVSNGKLSVEGMLTTGTGLLNGVNAVVAGKGVVAGLFDNAGKVVPGGDPGTLTVTGNVVMESGSQFGFNINSATGTAGGSLGWGLLSVGAQLSLLGPTTIDLETFTLSGDPGPIDPSMFNPQTPYLLEFAVAEGGINGFNASSWTVDASGFANDTEGGTFSVVELGNGLYLDFTPAAVPEPASLGLMAMGLACLGLSTLRFRHVCRLIPQLLDHAAERLMESRVRESWGFRSP